jgi:hypothetical protein
MEVMDVGRHWVVVMARRRFEFHHDGKGRVRMRANGPWQEVTPRWEKDGSLCWDGLCVRGDLPLD